MIRVAFATTDRLRVDLHFGASERLVIYDVSPGEAELVGVGNFAKAEMKGENKDKGLSRDGAVVMNAPVTITDPDLAQPEDKVIAKLEFLQGCSAVYAASIGASSIKRLMAIGIQPIIVGNGHEIIDLLNEVSLALTHGGLSWVDKAVAEHGRKAKSSSAPAELRQKLIASMDELT
ncbi:MAG TPA: NifB/NifX family molybdenum-iron cluster-binding protein [Candidatus Sulfotelmatobacter sp.]|jgi:nitrogen fixation protein NifX|nr:NifB/NifX family molybdenum-iron cluster-binding protein [Candidatus Sulfotelmatobacter sp.]